MESTLSARIMQGGPGCSSFDGLMMEVGPWRMDGKGGLQTKEGGWEEYANVVYGAIVHWRHRLLETNDTSCS